MQLLVQLRQFFFVFQQFIDQIRYAEYRHDDDQSLDQQMEEIVALTVIGIEIDQGQTGQQTQQGDQKQSAQTGHGIESYVGSGDGRPPLSR